MSLPFAYGTCPPQSSLRISLGPCGFCSDSEYAFIMLCISYDGPSDHFRSTDDTSPVGPCDACQFTSTRSLSTLRLLSTGRSCLFRLCSSRESASHVSCWIVLGYHPFRGFSLLAPQRPLGPRFPPCRFPILRLSQLRGFQLSNQVRSPSAVLFTPR